MSVEEKPKRDGDPKQGDVFAEPTTRATGAIALIAAGVFFLLSQYGLVSLQGNWWAIFIALPALAMLVAAYRAYQRDGHITTEVGSSIAGGVIVGMIAILAATNQMQLTLPFFLILLGVFVALGWNRPRDHRR